MNEREALLELLTILTTPLDSTEDYKTQFYRFKRLKEKLSSAATKNPAAQDEKSFKRIIAPFNKDEKSFMRVNARCPGCKANITVDDYTGSHWEYFPAAPLEITKLKSGDRIIMEKGTIRGVIRAEDSAGEKESPTCSCECAPCEHTPGYATEDGMLVNVKFQRGREEGYKAGYEKRAWEEVRSGPYQDGYRAGLEAAQQTAANVARVDGSAMAAVHAISEVVEAAKKKDAE